MEKLRLNIIKNKRQKGFILLFFNLGKNVFLIPLSLANKLQKVS